MTQVRPLISELIALQQAGQQEEAIQRCLAWLSVDAQDVEIWHLLSMFYVQADRLDDAQDSLEQALQQEPNNQVMQLHRAAIFKAKEQYPEAIQQLQAVIQAYPQSAAAYNNLGTVYFAQAKWPQAIQAFQLALQQQPDFADAYYNLGLAFAKAQQREPAENAYRALLQLDPAHVGGRFQWASLLMQRKQWQPAIEQFSIVEKNHPFHVETQANMAACYLHLGRLEEAVTHYLKALAITPSDSTLLFNLGAIRMQQGAVAQAIEHYQQAIHRVPDYFEAHHNLGGALLAKRDIPGAMAHFREALRIQPDNEAVKHTLGILTRDPTLTASSPDYIRTLFDSYANHYDAHLTKSLAYHVPDLFYQWMVAQAAPQPTQWDILDLGCGTGLCGILFKPWARLLTGVDLSENMLDVARQKHVYDVLVQSDIQAFLAQTAHAYDVILAGDVLVYQGDLAPIFSQLTRVLKPQGYFLFNAEITDSEDYRLTASGRFAHRRRYIDRLAQEQGLTVVRYGEVTLREQEHQPVVGHLYLLQKR